MLEKRIWERWLFYEYEFAKKEKQLEICQLNYKLLLKYLEEKKNG